MPQLLLLVSLICAIVLPPAYTQGISQEISCPPVIRANHLTINCFEQDLGKVSYPSVETPCGVMTDLTYEETYYQLAQNSNPGFPAYFELSRWEKINGDGGVDVTGAPNRILVEGANTAKVIVVPGQTLILRILVPARGYASFDCTNIGGSNLLFSAMVNNKVYPIKTKDFYRSALLQAGDVFELQMENTSKDWQEVKLTDFQFFTNAIVVLERNWKATDDKGNIANAKQFIAIESPSLSKVIFPENLDGQVNPILKTNDPKEPIFTGFPVFDEDGNALTMHDQHTLDARNCAFAVQWKDELRVDAQGYVLLRHWSVTDQNNNVREHTQIIRPQDISGFNLNAEELQQIQQPSVNTNGKKTSSIENKQQAAEGEIIAVAVPNKNNAYLQ